SRSTASRMGFSSSCAASHAVISASGPAGSTASTGTAATRAGLGALDEAPRGQVGVHATQTGGGDGPAVARRAGGGGGSHLGGERGIAQDLAGERRERARLSALDQKARAAVFDDR